MSTDHHQSRQPKGIPVGGQFATSAKAEAGLTLDPALDQDSVVDNPGVVDETQDYDADSVQEPVLAYTFPAWKTAKAVASIDKANRRAERAGIPERFTYTIENFEKTTKDELTGVEKIETMATLTLDRPVVKHDGWEFSATLTWDDEVGMVSRVVPGAELTERPRERVCDVCGSARDRKDTYVVQRTNPETGEREQMQVGSNCLTRFMGIRPAGLFMLEFDVDTSEGVTEPPANGPRVEPRYPSDYILGLGLAVAEERGWVSRSAAEAYNAAGGAKTATADVVYFVLNGKPTRAEEKREQERLRARAEELRAEGAAESLLEEARTIEGDSEYAINMRAIAAAESVTGRNMGLLLSAIAARQNRIDREVKAEALTTSKHIGKPKDKIKDVPVTVDSVSYHDGDYGVRTLVKMRDTDGNVIAWWGSGRHEFTEGGKYTLAATVKKHGEYQGVAETTVLRAKLVDADAPAPTVIPTANPKSIFAKHSDMQSLNAAADRSLNRLEGDKLAAKEAEYEARRKEIQEFERARQAAESEA